MIQKNKPTQEEINSIIVKILNQKIAEGINGYNKVDETTNKFLNLTLNYTYFLLSIDAACIAFIISLTVHVPIMKVDWLLVISLIFWVISFLFVHRTVSRYYIPTGVIGLGSALFGIAVTQGIYYYWYELVKAFFEKTSVEGKKLALTTAESMASGAVAGNPI